MFTPGLRGCGYSTASGRAKWPNRDPIGEFADRNLYRFNYNNPVNFVDPNGLWGIQFGDFNIGYGNPNLAFDNDSWMDLANGAAATMDGLIPVYDPFSDLYSNGDIWSDDNEGLSDWERDLYNKSHTGGQIAQVCLLPQPHSGPSPAPDNRLLISADLSSLAIG
ncbi:MAG: hypothetical protein GYA76_10995 [Verrucomicrobia bacterium]|jgi:hypothetical protein|nr:hypothetical protein [Verrucomicrobiota bacterium]